MAALVQKGAQHAAAAGGARLEAGDWEQLTAAAARAGTADNDVGHTSGSSSHTSSGELREWGAPAPRVSSGASPTPSERLAAAAWGGSPPRVARCTADSASELRRLLRGLKPAAEPAPPVDAPGSAAWGRGRGGAAAAEYYRRRQHRVLHEEGSFAAATPFAHPPAPLLGASSGGDSWEQGIPSVGAAGADEAAGREAAPLLPHQLQHHQRHQGHQQRWLGGPAVVDAEKVSAGASAQQGGGAVPTPRLLAGFYVLVNLFATVFIVMANKLVLSTFAFSFPVALTLLHALFTALGMELMAAGNLFALRATPLADTLPVSVAYVASIVLSNWSIQLNTVRIGFYQLCKVLITPGVVGLELLWLRKVPGRAAMASLLALLAGICIATLLDKQVSSNLYGAAVGLASTASCAVYQVLAAKKQRDLGLSGTQLLHQTMPSAALLLALLVPVAEPLGLPGPANAFTWGGRGTLLGYELSLPALVAILGSAALGLVVTLSAFLVIGATSALTYNVCSHMKTALVMAGGVVAWGDALPLAKLLGLLLALGGVVAYTSLQ